MMRHVCFVLFTLLAVAIPVRAEDAAPPAAEKLTGAELRQANRLLAQFRRARKDRQKQAALLQAATGLGRPAVVMLQGAVEQEMRPVMDRYRAKFQQQAERLINSRSSKVDWEEVKQLRSGVLDLQHQPDFSKEMIEKKADPALKRLAEILLVSPADVLSQSRDLQKERPKLQEIGVLWEMCAQYLNNEVPASQEKPGEPPSFEKYLAGEEELAIGLAAHMDPQTHETMLANSQLAAQLDPEEARAILALNLTRNLLGLRLLAIDPKLCATARDHSNDMREKKFFAHESPVPGKKTPWDRAKRFGTSASAENIFAGLTDGAAANLGWFHSPGHHKNMLGDHKRVGMGRSGAYFTEMFGG